MGNIRYQRTAHRITSAVNCRPLKPSPRSICPAAPYPTGVHIPGIPPPAKFATEPDGAPSLNSASSLLLRRILAPPRQSAEVRFLAPPIHSEGRSQRAAQGRNSHVREASAND